MIINLLLARNGEINCFYRLGNAGTWPNFLIFNFNVNISCFQTSTFDNGEISCEGVAWGRGILKAIDIIWVVRRARTYISPHESRRLVPSLSLTPSSNQVQWHELNLSLYCNTVYQQSLFNQRFHGCLQIYIQPLHSCFGIWPHYVLNLLM